MFWHIGLFTSGKRANNARFFSLLCFQVVAVLLLVPFCNSAQNMKLYYSQGSAPCRSILLLLKTLKYENIDFQLMDLSKKEHLTPEFLKINPQHCIPTLVDGEFIIWESRAILIYLFEKVGKGESLYPKDRDLRAVIHQRLFFDIGTLYQRFADAYYPLIFYGQQLEDAKVKKLEEAFKFLDIFLNSEAKWVAGEDMTLADFSIVATVSTAEAVQFNITQFPNVYSWFLKCKGAMLNYEQVNEPGCAIYRQRYKDAIKKLN